jgi:hypothetical protein
MTLYRQKNKIITTNKVKIRFTDSPMPEKNENREGRNAKPIS